jgi:hypothetical protein
MTYYQEHKEEMKNNHKVWRENNKNKDAEYYLKHKQKRKEYYKSPAGKKSTRINNWKRLGIICDDWDTLYERYINTNNCERCNKEIKKKCLDHNHNTGEIRYVCCYSCNIMLGIQDSKNISSVREDVSGGHILKE